MDYEYIKPGKILGNHEKELEQYLEDCEQDEILEMVENTLEDPDYIPNKFHDMVENIHHWGANKGKNLSDSQLYVLKKHLISNAHLVEIP